MSSATAPVRERDAERPAVRLAPGVVVLPDLAGGACDRVVELPGNRLTRVGADAGRLLDALEDPGSAPTAATLAARLGRPWTAGVVDETVGRLDALGITGPGAETAVRRERRIEYRAPMALQVTLVRPDRLLDDVAPALRVLTGRVGTAIALLLVGAGLPLVLASLAPGSPALHRPAGLATYGLVLLALVGTVALHELAHGAVLAAGGGRPRRMGFMVFYLLPAFFCDVSDAWRLVPNERVRVAMAGIVTQGALGGLAALAALPAGGDLEQGLVFYALLCYAYGVVNLVPFVKLDGYVALTGGLDLPFLRSRAMADFQALAAQRLLGAPCPPRQLDRVWGRWFGAACTLTPVLVLAGAAASLGPALLPLGTAGALAALALALLLVALGLRGVAGFVAAAVRRGAGRVRTAAVLGVVALAVAATLIAVRVPRTVNGGYAILAGTPNLVLGLGASAADDLRPGTRVAIARSGLLAGDRVATATVAGRPRRCDAPLGALVPVRSGGYTLAAQCLPLRLRAAARTPPRTGRTTASAPDAALGAWLAGQFVTPSLDALGVTG